MALAWSAGVLALAAHGGLRVRNFWWGFVLAMMPLWWLTAVGGWIIWRLATRDDRRRQGRCQECGYDLTGNVSRVCPECGSLISP